MTAKDYAYLESLYKHLHQNTYKKRTQCLKYQNQAAALINEVT